jgi:hypothetical protein
VKGARRLIFDILPYSRETLLACFLDESLSTAANISGSRRTRYFQQYFEELKAATILVEKDYVDRDYLHDYAEYYDRCFRDYPRRTRRLHFFSLDFSLEDFEQALISDSEGGIAPKLQESYLGFIVVKPLPQTIIGRTCLQTYSDDSGRRNFPCLRGYLVNLYGLELEVRTLAFQEQDQVVAACATSALWTCLQGTGKLFQHPIPAPVEITKWAGDQIPENVVAGGARSFPNNGLTVRQMAHAIRRVDLEPHVIRTGDKYNLHSAVYAYLKGKIPPILSTQLVDHTGDNKTFRGAHSVAVTGFSLRDDAEYVCPPSGFRLRAARLDKLYVHDDQVGPFCRMWWELLPIPERVSGEEQYSGLKTSWSDTLYHFPDFILLPLYHKIRIPFSLIHDAMLVLDSFMTALRRDAGIDAEPPEWDIFLTTVNDYKSSIRHEYTAFGTDFLKRSLYARMPRFLWRVIVRRGENIQMDFLFDATGVAQHNLLMNVVSIACEDRDLIARLAEPEYLEVVNQFPLQARSVIDAFAEADAAEIRDYMSPLSR